MGTNVILTNKDYDKKVAIMMDHVAAIIEFELDSDGCRIVFSGGNNFVVNESYKEVMAKLFGGTGKYNVE